MTKHGTKIDCDIILEYDKERIQTCTIDRVSQQNCNWNLKDYDSNIH